MSLIFYPSNRDNQCFTFILLRLINYYIEDNGKEYKF